MLSAKYPDSGIILGADKNNMDISPIPLTSLLVCLLVLTMLDKPKPRTKKKKKSLSQRLRTLFIKSPQATIRKKLPK